MYIFTTVFPIADHLLTVRSYDLRKRADKPSTEATVLIL